MSIEDRLAALEARLRKTEDRLEITNLLMSYGPLVDSGSSEPAAKLWAAGGGYTFSGGFSGGTRLEAPKQLVDMYDSNEHRWLVLSGVSHFTGTPRIEVNGDTATAIAYSFVVLKEKDRWYFWRAAINEWKLVRTAEGWRIAERFNRALDGSKGSHEMMRKVITQ